MNDVLAQGRSLGLRSGVHCEREVERVQCEGGLYASASVSTAPMAPRRSVLFSLEYGVFNPDLGASKSLILRFSDDPTVVGTCYAEEAPPCVDHVADFHVSDRGSPRVSAHVGAVLEPRFGPNELRLLPGTHPVAHVVSTRGRGDALWLLKVDGDIRVAAKRYEAAIARHDFSPRYSGRRRRNEAGWHVDEWWISGDADPSLLVDVLQRGSTNYLAVRVTAYA